MNEWKKEHLPAHCTDGGVYIQNSQACEHVSKMLIMAFAQWQMSVKMKMSWSVCVLSCHIA